MTEDDRKTVLEAAEAADFAAEFGTNYDQMEKSRRLAARLRDMAERMGADTEVRLRAELEETKHALRMQSRL